MASGPCERCGVERQSLHRHHVVPRALGGTDADGVELLCANCHEDTHGGPCGGGQRGVYAQSPEAQAKRSAGLKAAWARGAFKDRPKLTAEQHRQRLKKANAARRAAKGTPREAERAAKSARTRQLQAAARSAERNQRIAELRAAGVAVRSIAELVGCSTPTVYYVLKLQREGLI